MNWIIQKTNKLSCHTDLTSLIVPIWEDIKAFNWIVSDLDFMASVPLPIDFDHDYFILSAEQFEIVAQSNTQFNWGVFLGFPADRRIKVDENNLPYAEGNELIWENGNIQHPDAVIEIICFDSGYTIVKFRDSLLSAKFRNYFDEAVELERFK